MTYRPRTLLIWFALAGGPVAWAVQHAAGVLLSYGRCNQSGLRWHFPVQAWQVGLAAGALVVALASTAVAIRIFVRTFRIGDIFGQERRGDGSQPPLGRVHFMAICGLVTNFLALTIIALDAIGTGLLGLCQQT